MNFKYSEAMPFLSFCLRYMTLFFTEILPPKIKTMEKRAKSRKRCASAHKDSIECFYASCAFTSEVQVKLGDLRQVGLRGAPMSQLATSAVLADFNLAASDHLENIRFGC
jgi:hypothetical protein